MIDPEEPCSLKRIEVFPGHRLSYQYHSHRSESWTIIQGEGTLTLDDKSIKMSIGQNVSIPVKAKHRIKNTGSENLVFIEVQTGSYFGEDDIVRIKDDYKRI